MSEQQEKAVREVLNATLPKWDETGDPVYRVLATEAYAAGKRDERERWEAVRLLLAKTCDYLSEDGAIYKDSCAHAELLASMKEPTP